MSAGDLDKERMSGVSRVLAGTKAKGCLSPYTCHEKSVDLARRQRGSLRPRTREVICPIIAIDHTTEQSQEW